MSPERINCGICKLQDIHRNDFEKHCNGRKHKYKLRSLSKVSKEEGKDIFRPYTCNYCNRRFTEEKFYEIHQGTKTHRRNVRKKGGALATGIRVRPAITISAIEYRTTTRFRSIPFVIPQDEGIDVTRKKYKIRSIKTEDLNFKTYIYSMTAFLSMRLALDQNVEEFSISANNRDWGAFGDIIIKVTCKDKNTIYAVQCKNVTQIRKQISFLEEAKVHLEKQYDHLATLKSLKKDFTDTRFVIFTTHNTSSNFCKFVTLKSKVLNKWKTDHEVTISENVSIQLTPLTKKNDIINVTSEPENIYSFHLTQNVKCALPHIFFYTGQRVTPTMIHQLLKPKFDNYPDISKEYTKYIEHWAEGKLGGNYILHKKDVVLKIGEILLHPYTVSPKKVQSTLDSFDIWNQVMKNVDLTVVQNEPFTISKICQPFNMIIEKTLHTNIDTITKSVNIKNGEKSLLDDLKDPIKFYFFESGQDKLRDDIPLHVVYNIFWKAGKIPLLMSTEDKEECKGFILDVLLFMKSMGVNKKYLLKTADLNLHFKGNLNLFTCLNDITSYINLDDLKIRVSETLQLSLSQIGETDPFFFKWVTPNIFFDIALNKYSLKPRHSTKKEKDELKLILSDELKEQVQNSLYHETRLLRMNSESYEEVLRGIDPSLF